MKKLRLLLNFMHGNIYTYIKAIGALGLATFFWLISPLVLRLTIDSIIGDTPMVNLPDWTMGAHHITGRQKRAGSKFMDHEQRPRCTRGREWSGQLLERQMVGGGIRGKRPKHAGTVVRSSPATAVRLSRESRDRRSDPALHLRCGHGAAISGGAIRGGRTRDLFVRGATANHAVAQPENDAGHAGRRAGALRIFSHLFCENQKGI